MPDFFRETKKKHLPKSSWNGPLYTSLALAGGKRSCGLPFFITSDLEKKNRGRKTRDNFSCKTRLVLHLYWIQVHQVLHHETQQYQGAILRSEIFDTLTSRGSRRNNEGKPSLVSNICYQIFNIPELYGLEKWYLRLQLWRHAWSNFSGCRSSLSDAGCFLDASQWFACKGLVLGFPAAQELRWPFYRHCIALSQNCIALFPNCNPCLAQVHCTFDVFRCTFLQYCNALLLKLQCMFVKMQCVSLVFFGYPQKKVFSKQVLRNTAYHREHNFSCKTSSVGQGSKLVQFSCFCCLLSSPPLFAFRAIVSVLSYDSYVQTWRNCISFKSIGQASGCYWLFLVFLLAGSLFACP